MNCDHEGCAKNACAMTSEWLKTGGLFVKYWCKEHAPDGAEWICWANAMTVGCCPECELTKQQEPTP